MHATLRFRRALLALLVTVVCSSAAKGAESLPGHLPLRRDAQAVSELGSWMPSLLLLGLAVAAGGYLLWRRGSAASAHPLPSRREELTVMRLSSHALTPQASIHALRWNGEEFLVGCTLQQVTLLARRPSPVDPGELTP